VDITQPLSIKTICSTCVEMDRRVNSVWVKK